MKDLISLSHLSKDEILQLLDFADDLKKMRKSGDPFKPLRDKLVITSFPPTSLRTRVSFEAGIMQLGGNVINLPIDFEARDTVEDKIGHLNNWIDYLVVRYPKEAVMEEMAGLAKFSVVNAMSSQSHPCEILSDLQTLRELRPNLTSLKFVFVGEGANISNTWFQAASKLGLNLTQVCPEGYEVAPHLLNAITTSSLPAAEGGGVLQVTHDLEAGLKGADVVLTDGWPPNNENGDVHRAFHPYQITLERLKLANRDCIVNPCPPSTRGQEVTAEVMASKYFIGYGGKENLLHMQKAILASLKK